MCGSQTPFKGTTGLRGFELTRTRSFPFLGAACGAGKPEPPVLCKRAVPSQLSSWTCPLGSLPQGWRI